VDAIEISQSLVNPALAERAPASNAGQGRLFFYEAQKDDITVKSCDFDDVYD
jgi:hypothetical protein